MQQVIKQWLDTGCGRYQKFPWASRRKHDRRALCTLVDTKTLLLAQEGPKSQITSKWGALWGSITGSISAGDGIQPA